MIKKRIKKGSAMNRNIKYLDHIVSKNLKLLKNIITEKEDTATRETIKCVLESSIYTLIILVVFYFLPFARNNFLNLNLHPLAVMVAFMALRYGTYLGFISAFIATAGYLFAYLNSGNDMILFLLKFQYYKFFLMFLFIAMLMGRFQSNSRIMEEELRNEKEKIEEMYEKEKKMNKEMLDINLSLKNQIIQTKNGIISFQKFRKNLQKCQLPEEIYEETAVFLNTSLNCENTSIYLKNENSLNQIVKIGNGSLNKNIELGNSESNRFLEAFHKGKPLEFSTDLKGSQPIFVAPIFFKKEVSAFIEVSRLSYSSSKSYTFEVFKILTDEVNNILDKLSDKSL